MWRRDITRRAVSHRGEGMPNWAFQPNAVKIALIESVNVSVAALRHIGADVRTGALTRDQQTLQREGVGLAERDLCNEPD
ncbi:hypothetical protein MPC4_170071 [Methylocella tundrae]|uniref:Uncharacterized protein n=1 Tax=Methylocella tundrae TaxID=227605 RepID=A0A8B6M5C8_METTU|nr:hypothetical protein MPC4_170071 [Methylocella tundrae]